MSIQGHLLEVTVVGCNRLRDTEWVTRQDPYVFLEYAGTKFRTRTCTDGGKNPTFQDKFVFYLIDGLREITISVWNSNTHTFDDCIGSSKVQLHRVLSLGYDDSPATIQDKSGKFAGEVTLVMHYSNAQKAGRTYVPTAASYATAAPPPAALPCAQPYFAAAYAPSPAPVLGAYPPAPPTPFCPSPGYPTAATPISYPSYPPSSPATLYPAAPAYPPQTYPPAPYPAAAPQAIYPATYPPAAGPYSVYPPPPPY